MRRSGPLTCSLVGLKGPSFKMLQAQSSSGNGEMSNLVHTAFMSVSSGGFAP